MQLAKNRRVVNLKSRVLYLKYIISDLEDLCEYIGKDIAPDDIDISLLPVYISVTKSLSAKFDKFSF